jgi:hypothetical protein
MDHSRDLPETLILSVGLKVCFRNAQNKLNGFENSKERLVDLAEIGCVVSGLCRPRTGNHWTVKFGYVR